MGNSPSEKSRLKQIVRSLILAQGNVFIKELLRGKQKSGADVAIGSTKAEFEKNLVLALHGPKNPLKLVDVTSFLQFRGHFIELPTELYK